MNTIIKLLRVKQWTKNAFVLVAFVFTNQATNGTPEVFRATLLAFLGMCFVSSATYIANDIKDVEKDRAHPVKKNRPIASGAIKPTVAAAIAVLCLAGGLGMGFAVGRAVLACQLAYLGLQVAYNYGLKAYAVADVFTIATGFVLRVVVGAVAIHVQLSGWILLCTACLAFVLGFGKRRHEYHLKKDSGFGSRSALSKYNEKSLDVLVVFSAALAAMSYALYSIESGTAKSYRGIIMTTPFVLYGIARYLLIVFVAEESGEPESLILKDKHLIIAMLGFLLTAIAALRGVELPFLLH